jgi:hypothetical protein
MPHVGPVLEGRTFFCPHCGALYSVTHFQLSKSESNTAKCVVCLKVMDRWGRACRPLGSSWHPGGRGGCPWRPSSAARPPLRLKLLLRRFGLRAIKIERTTDDD